eukprot:2748451-Pyramimonas_sp.AAC.2
MASRYACKWKFVKTTKANLSEQCDCATFFAPPWASKHSTRRLFSGAARRASQRLLACAAACEEQWITASMDIDEAFLKGLTSRALADATGES